MAIYSGFTHWKWWFAIVLLVYQRVPVPYHIIIPLSPISHQQNPPHLCHFVGSPAEPLSSMGPIQLVPGSNLTNGCVVGEWTCSPQEDFGGFGVVEACWCWPPQTLLTTPWLVIEKIKTDLVFFCLEDEQLKYLKLSKTMTHYILGRHQLGQETAASTSFLADTCTGTRRFLMDLFDDTNRPILKRTHLLWLKVTRMYIYIYIMWAVKVKSYVMI